MKNNKSIRHRRCGGAVAGLLVALLLAGCASVAHPDPRDPWESYNRAMTRFNDDVDDALLKPVAKAYKTVVPQTARTGVGNFFGNLGDAWSAVNSALQLRGQDAFDNFVRFSFNTVFGLGGVLDIAGEAGVPRHREDFGRTLGRWGMPAGPYLVLPLLGPSTVRDTAALPVDWQGNLIRYVTPVDDRNALYGLQTVAARANLLRASSLLEQSALDPYAFMRDAYLQSRGVKLGNEENENNESPSPQNQNVPLFRWNLPSIPNPLH